MRRTRRAVEWVWRASSRLTVAGVVIVIVQGLLPLVSLWALKLVVDAVTAAVRSGHLRGSALVGPLALAASSAGAGVVVARIGQLVTLTHGQAASEFMTQRLHEQSIRLDLGYYEDPAFYDTAHRAQDDAPERPARVLGGLVAVCQSVIVLGAVAVLLVTVAWWVGAALVLAAVPGVRARLAHARALYGWELSRTPQQRLGWYYNWLITHEFHAQELRLLGIGPLLSRRAQAVRGQLRSERLALARRRAGGELASDLLVTAVAYGVLAWLAVRAADGRTSVGSLVLYFAAVQRCQQALAGLLGGLVELYESSLFIQNLVDFLDLPSRLPEPVAPRLVPRPVRAGIELRDVSFTYPGALHPALDTVSLRIEAGEHVALVGANGAGKSTLVKLLCRLYDPATGAVLVDDIDLREFDSCGWRRELAVVFQDYACYQLSARENVWLGDSQLDPLDPRVADAARAGGAHELLSGLPQGYDTRLGHWFKDGQELSIGEWQKVALSRAFLRPSQLVILDEPTSALDANAERELFAQFDQLTAGRTAILVSHRLSTVKMVDRVIVLDRGRVVQSGTHRALLDTDGIYADLYSDQAARPSRVP